jgi:RNA polymerase sigma factor (sigma-70 family)
MFDPLLRFIRVGALALAGTHQAPAAKKVIASVDWQRAIERHDRRVLVSLLARGVRLERARELTHETWLRLIEQHRAGRLAEVQLPGLAITQALFLAKDDFRRQRARDARADDGVVPCAPAGAIDLERQLIDRQELERAALALESCPAAERRVFDFCYQNPELGHAEVASRLGLSVQRIRQTLCKVRKVLRQAIEDGSK